MVAMEMRGFEIWYKLLILLVPDLSIFFLQCNYFLSQLLYHTTNDISKVVDINVEFKPLLSSFAVKGYQFL